MAKKYTREEIMEKLTGILVNDFEIKKEQIVPEANLFEDLDFDSIDAIDLAVRLQDFVPKKVTPDEFREIKTIQDVVNTIEKLI